MADLDESNIPSEVERPPVSDPGWRPEAAEIAFRRREAEGLGGSEAIDKHHGRGRLTVRERISALTDPASFQEVGALAGTGRYEDGKLVGVTPAPYVMGLASIDGRPVAIGGEDFTVRGGSSWKVSRRKGGQGGFVEDLAFEYRLPLVCLIDGAGGSVTSLLRRGHSVFPGVDGFERSVELMGMVPVVCAVLGTAAGGPAGRAILAHWSVMVEETSQIFAAGPPVVERALGQMLSREDLGGSYIAADLAGTIHNVASSEEECLAMIRRYLSYMPRHVWELPPVVDLGDPPNRSEEELIDIVPKNRRRPYDMGRLIELIVDRQSVFEIQPSYGQSVITSLARLNGRVVGIIANNPMKFGGAIDSAAARKQTHFVELCDTFHIPLVFLVDVPGFMVGQDAEVDGTLLEGMRSLYVTMQATVPIFTVVIRKCYGMAGMAAVDKNGLRFKVAWPSAEWGSLPIEGGVAAAHRSELAQADDPAQRELEIEAEYRAVSSPFLTAEAFGVEDIIDPRETRAYLCRFLEVAEERLAADVGPKARYGVRP